MNDHTSFTDALRSKYCDDDADDSGFEGFVNITVFGGKRQRTRGSSNGDANGQGNGGGTGGDAAELAYLKNVVLDNKKISHAAVPSIGLSSLCPNVLELDLSGNVMESWNEVLMILRHLPHLRFVNLSSNPLRRLEPHISNCDKIPCSIQDLVLNDTKVSWSDVAALSRLMPKLERLHLCKNGWDEIFKLRLLPSLLSLVLLDNPLEEVYYKQTHPSDRCRSLDDAEVGEGNVDLVEAEDPSQASNRSLPDHSVRGNDPEACNQLTSTDACSEVILGSEVAHEEAEEPYSDEEIKEGLPCSAGISNAPATAELQLSASPDDEAQSEANFKTLESLCLTGTALADWQHLQELRHFPELHSVKMKNIPLLEDWEENDRRKLSIACLPSIKRLNGSEITTDEREKAERHFVRLFVDHSDPPQRHCELVQKYGKLKPLHQVDLGRGFQEFTKLRFIYRGCCVQEEVIRIVEPIRRLKEYCAKMVDHKPRMLKLYHKTLDEDTGQVIMEELFLDSLPMSRFDLRDGDEIHIDVDTQAKNMWWKPGIKLAP